MASPDMPAVFIGHGSPMNTLERNSHTVAWQRLGRELPRPRAILSVSAHWTTRGTAVTAMEHPRTIHDFGGFPDALFAVQYPAPGSPDLAQRVYELLQPIPVELDRHWGLDHGTWSVLAHLYPEADIPVVQLSLDIRQPPAYHYRLAEQLRPLRSEGILVLASGNVVHNLMQVRWGDDAVPYDWAARFNDHVRQELQAGRHDTLLDLASNENARLSIPTPEHYLPLVYVLALQRPDDTLVFPTDGIEMGSISMMSVVVGAAGLLPRPEG